ncbi:flagellar filament capping protein FliD [Shewanella corallii]|uniref:Flagellar hook-associated protein 2 n=1 Tax=Shewanella corallii TaxID=560080 RepID=A0ABT0NB24_9GAMM|nr:flagellar filament capping protein FliD [Shewanella corallii]MCL2915037.1 flagellar filament capping protein FliD [Shewanella corallii]
MISGMSGAQFAEQLIAAERMGKDQLYKAKMDKYEDQLDAYKLLDRSMDKIISKLEKLENGSFEAKKADVTGENATVTVSPDSPAGDYELQVHQLAQAHQLSKTFGSETDLLPTSGVLSINVGGKQLDLDMSVLNADGSKTVTSLRDMINDHPDNPGVQASLVRTGGQVELMMTAKETGAASTISVTMDGADWGMTERRAAQDAQITLNGIAISNSSNQLTNVIDGMDIELRQTHAAGESSMISVKADYEASEEAVEDFVDAVNDLLDQINSLTRSMGAEALDEDDKDKDDEDKDDDDDRPTSVDEDQIGILKGDSTIRNLQSKLRNIVFADAPNGMRLGDIGIELTRSGKLEIDSEKLTDALKNNPAGITEMFTSKGGLVDQLENTIEPFTKFDGYLDNKKDTLDGQIDRVEDNIDRHNRLMEQRYQIYLGQFTAMESAINEMNSASMLFY